MNIKSGLTALLIAMPLLAQAGAREELMALEATKMAPSTDAAAITASTIPVPAPVNLMSLPDGRKANMKDYAVVLFMQAHCQYSAKFDPLLKGWADQHDIRVYPYTLDGGGDGSFPTPMIPRKTDPNSPIADEIVTFFGNGLPIATPTTFMVNVNTNMAYPLYQGDTDMGTVSQRLAQMIEADIDHLPPDTLGPVPSSASLTPQ